MIWQQMINGLTLGVIYSLLAIGLVVIYSTTRTVNFAHGEMFSLGAFLALILTRQAHLPFGIAAICAVAGVFALSALFVWLVSTKLRDSLSQSVATIALGFGLRDLMLVLFGSDSEALPSVYPQGGLELYGLHLSYSAAIICAVTIVVLAGMGFFVKHTRWGIFARAAAQQGALARRVGIDTRKFAVVAFAGGTALAAMAGVLVSPQWHVSYSAGSAIGLKAFTAALIGGFSSSTGTLLGGLFIGLLETFASGYVSSTWKDLDVYICLLLTLVFLPRGLHGITKHRVA